MNADNLNQFIREIRAAQIRAAKLRDLAKHNALDLSTLFDKAMTELFVNLEALQVAAVELPSQQNELLDVQQRLADQTLYYQELLDFAPDAYIVTDLLGSIRDANRAAAELFNRNREFLIGKPLSVFIRLDKRAEFRSQLQILRSTHQASVWETFVQPSRSNPVKVSVSTQLGGGERLYWLLRKAEPEAAAKASEVASKIETQDIQMMATVSHELRTPLSSIKGFVSSLLAKDVDFDDATRREFLQIVNEEADKLSELVEQLLDYSRVKSATLRINPEEHHLFDILAMANASLEELTKSHKLEIQVSNDLPLVKADILRVSQVILNLVDNAVKYSPPDSRIAISAHQQDESVQVDVSDQGIGIPPEDRPHVFEAFRQTERKTQLKGTGLGLAICKGIIEAHGGAIWIQDQVVSGTTISFTLPLSE